MLKIKEYVRVESLEEAYQLNQKKNNRMIGGMLWMKMTNYNIQTAIDLSGLGLDQIEENEEEFAIGCMVTLRQLELHSGLDQWTKGAVRESVRHIVGVQFRNLATIGGSLYGRYGFSDVLTCFMGLDAYVELYKGGRMTVREFADRPKDRDILVRIIVKKTPGFYAYLSHRNTKTDFPVIACMMSVDALGVRVCVGARPGKAMMIPVGEEASEIFAKENGSVEEVKRVAKEIAGNVPTGSNMRAGAEYRSHLAAVLIGRGFEKILNEQRRA